MNTVWASSPGKRGHWKCGALLGASRWRYCVFTFHCPIPKHRLIYKDLVSKTLCSSVSFLLPTPYPKQPLLICSLSTYLSFGLNLAVTIKSISSILQDRTRAPNYQPPLPLESTCISVTNVTTSRAAVAAEEEIRRGASRATDLCSLNS